jgi:aminomethyltransferase
MRTPLYAEHLALGAQMVPFAGWEMPLLYEGIIAEHQQTRQRATLFDICHMGEFELSGPEAAADLERLLTLRVARIKPGACAYGFLLAEDGGVLDDLICYRLAADRFWLVVNAGTAAADAAWIKAHLSAGTLFTDLSPQLAKLDIQGPQARELLEEALGESLPELRYFHFQEVTLSGVEGLLSRTGYTGEWGYEWFFPRAAACRCWKRILAPGHIRPAGLGARDTLRVEMGYLLYGHELSTARTPAGASQGRFLDLDKPFIGREAVRRDLEREDLEVLVGLQIAGRMAARPGAQVWNGERAVGRVTSGLFAPSLNRAVALAYLETSAAVLGQAVEVEARGRRLAAKVAPLPFYTAGTARGRSAGGEEP